MILSNLHTCLTPFVVLFLILVFLLIKKNQVIKIQSQINLTQVVLAKILQKTSDTNLSIKEIFQITINELYLAPWVQSTTKISFYLAENNHSLKLIAHQNFDSEMLSACSSVKKNEYFCGKSFQDKEVRFSNNSSQNDCKFLPFQNGFSHYSIPILWENRVLGLIYICFDKKQKKNSLEENFLKNLALSLSNTIIHNNAEAKLKKYVTEQRLSNQKLVANNLNIGHEKRKMQLLVDNIQKTNNEVLLQQLQLEETHKDITDSIDYAKTIQDALIPTKRIVSKILWKYFILFKPKNVVSGDFYYVSQKNKIIYISVADCTGHGIAGAFLSILGISFIQDIVKWQEVKTPAEILNTLRKRIKRIFIDSGSNSRNGMDMSFCMIDTDTNILQYSGAFNSIFIIRNNEITELKANRNPIGFYIKEKDFTNTEFQLESGDKIYLFSDGFTDQFGGENQRKFSKKRFKEVLLEINKFPMVEQKEKLTSTLYDWTGEHQSQIDDITVMGIEWK